MKLKKTSPERKKKKENERRNKSRLEREATKNYAFLTFTQVRSWWNLSDKKTANVVEKFTSTHVTPALWNSEVTRIQETKASFDNMTVNLQFKKYIYSMKS